MAARQALQVHLDLLSQPCRALHILLACTRLPHTVRHVALRRGEHRTPEFTEINPMQKVPVMVLLPAQTGSPVEEQHLMGALSQLQETLDQLESMFLRRQPFLCGDDITVADLLAVCELMQPEGGGRDVLQDRPLLQRWKSRVRAAVGDAFDQAHAVLYALRDRRRAKL
ncbi:Glutathione S-transferase theta-1 [Dissostichus eleginoides]|uniref:Glutathione S-transferase theta-1 n=1 Tax=Dissostichus eleginoides TaxID=100907 RepID=A0AAD9BZQ6_DISEL|nr:Glutathione S-transferase theta-1 [Dissostichus eleginoides]